MASLVPRKRPQDGDIDTLRARATELESILETRSAEVTDTRTGLAAFRLRYRQEVGMLHEELEDLERAIAEEELGAFAKRLEEEAPGGAASTAAPPASAPRYTTDSVRRLFRDVAKAIHPDLAADHHARDRRHRLMIEANRAYALGDEEQLRSILAAWENSPEAVTGSSQDAMRERLLRRIAQIEEQLRAHARELEELKDTPLWKLKAMVDEAADTGKDLVADMVRRLQRDIIAARNRLDAMRWNP